jgi:hypothetical protein
LLRKKGFEVSDTGYFVYANGIRDKEAFDGKLEFSVKVIPYDGDDSWVEGTLIKIKETLDDGRVPLASEDCEYCQYRTAVHSVISKNKESDKAGENDDKETLF